ncbi:MAG: L-glutamate gamma-semialdehyde dehydrogenase [Gemmatimonadetes bacterium]|nr:L-glutamate gamma-semialdehyde dehydrogenase [Gemmatimonadota bacterium]MBI3504347.1 L-glutamate gamma-semialdehyde dehydrogenase [Pseudomonadota bacterium]
MSHYANNGVRRLPPIANEPIKSYAPGTADRAELKARLAAMEKECPEIPLVIGGKEIRTGDIAKATSPHKHRHVTATWHKARPEDVHAAIKASNDARKEWASWKWEDRAGVLLKAADLLSGPWRSTLNAATMLGQSKTAFQAEIDSACEIIDFWRFNTRFAAQLYAEQPISSQGVWNQTDYRGLEGFVYAISPFNFTAIGANLPTAPALMGCTTVWKPAGTAVLSAWYTLQLLHAAGMPPGVINFVPGDAGMITDILLGDRDFGGVHFTGSTAVFNSMWKTIGQNMDKYKSYPRIVGETGGKDFLVAHPSADAAAVAVAIVRGGYEYQGQKCSALSRAYIPKSLWPEVKERVLAMIAEIKMGDPNDFRNFMGAVIDKKAFTRISGYLADAKQHAKVLAGGNSDDSTGWFVEPTLIQTDNPGYRLMCEEIFGPVVTAYVYDDAKWAETLRTVDETSPYALTGSVFARDKNAIADAHRELRNAAGNFYVNDKPTGATVGQQPFGGARASGTNDKAGSKLNLTRWVSARTIKETFVPPTEYKYPFMGAE